MGTRSLTPERGIRRPRQIDLRVVLSFLVTVAAIGGMPLYANAFAATDTELGWTLASATRGGDLGAALFPPLPQSTVSVFSSFHLDYRCQAAAEGGL